MGFLIIPVWHRSVALQIRRLKLRAQMLRRQARRVFRQIRQLRREARREREMLITEEKLERHLLRWQKFAPYELVHHYRTVFDGALEGNNLYGLTPDTFYSRAPDGILLDALYGFPGAGYVFPRHGRQDDIEFDEYVPMPGSSVHYTRSPRVLSGLDRLPNQYGALAENGLSATASYPWSYEEQPVYGSASFYPAAREGPSTTVGWQMGGYYQARSTQPQQQQQQTSFENAHLLKDLYTSTPSQQTAYETPEDSFTFDPNHFESMLPRELYCIME